jgi:hypothetical protein
MSEPGTGMSLTFFTVCGLLCGLDLADWLARLAVDAEVATILGSIPESSDTVESEGRQMKEC